LEGLYAAGNVMQQCRAAPQWPEVLAVCHRIYSKKILKFLCAHGRYDIIDPKGRRYLHLHAKHKSLTTCHFLIGRLGYLRWISVEFFSINLGFNIETSHPLAFAGQNI
jgi:hypothetical protein